MIAYDILELFAFVHPARFSVPTPAGLAACLDLAPPTGHLAQAGCLLAIAERLLDDVAEQAHDHATVAVARVMAECQWPWGPLVLDALGADDAVPGTGLGSFQVWKTLPEWTDHGPEPPGDQVPIEHQEARQRLMTMLGQRSEDRPSQADYSVAVTDIFQRREQANVPNMVLAEAGTGVGKTLGYIAPASLWAERNGQPVWISTYTRNLQHQIDSELARLHPDPVRKSTRVVIRKGRENYLCLFNLEQAIPAHTMGLNRQDATALGLMVRWARETRDGDMTGGDFPAWLVDLLGFRLTLGLSDRKRECIYSGCPHYRTCYIEKSIRRARQADLVVSNHALSMAQAAASSAPDQTGRSPRYIFDEGHHVFDAADGAFAVRLSGRETAELRRWLGSAAGRSRGLNTRLELLQLDDPEIADAMREIRVAARALPGEDWLAHLQEGRPVGPAALFLAQVRQQVLARTSNGEFYTTEAPVQPATDDLTDAAAALDAALQVLIEPVRRLRSGLIRILDSKSGSLSTSSRSRIEALTRALAHRGEEVIATWQMMLRLFASETAPRFVDWLEIERRGGKETDIGMVRHWLDPTEPFHDTLLKQAHGVLVTSATLRDASGDAEQDWAAAERRTGARHLAKPAMRVAVTSPFDYARQTRVFILQDVNRNDIGQVAAACRELFLAARGGALGLFTAIQRLRAVYDRIAAPIDQAGYPIYAQHVDALNTATLIEIFRAETDACLLGTDAVRDGVDVPGMSLRLLTFDRLPWPRPTILQKARENAFGGPAYREMLIRLKLRQAFGRLVRRIDDRGVFVMLDPRMPMRLTKAFPEGTQILRCGIAEAVERTSAFLHGTE